MVDRRVEDNPNDPAARTDIRRRLRSADNDAEPPATPTIPERTESSGRDEVPETSGKVILEETLPSRVFAMECYPEAERLNIYSRSNVIGRVAHALGGTESLETILGSQFRQLFMLAVARCHNSGKLIHSLLARQLITKKKYELWSVFGGKPLRFSIREFQRVTGLKSSKIPGGHSLVPVVSKQRSRKWKELFGPHCMHVSVDDALNLLEDPHLAECKRLPIALIVLVDGVLVMNKTRKLTPAYVDMLEDVQPFLDFPWGRLSFIRTLSRFGPEPLSTKTPDPITKLKNRLRQQTSACYGFPLALQLIAFEAIPLILEKIPDSTKTATFLEEPLACVTPAILLEAEDILEVEHNPKLIVQGYLPEDEDSDLDWDNEVEDDTVDRMVELLRSGHVFTPHEFRGGDSSSRHVTRQTDGGSASMGDTPGAASRVKRKPHRKNQNCNPGKRAKRPSGRDANQENAPTFVENMAELKEWITGQLRNWKDEVVELISSKLEKRDGGDVKENVKKTDQEIAKEAQENKKTKENVLHHVGKGEAREEDKLKDSEEEIDDVIAVGVKAKVKVCDANKAGTSRRRSSRLKGKEHADSVSLDAPSLHDEEAEGSGQKQQLESDNRDEELSTYDV
ncbi:unnamed protein product [Microthlaspi erraticum]|uniref:DUF1985 domain-containing protein n=1 Tax=Microthlaspi erraticum TaxID=1685480 RepID=A0A6D2IQF5_9BRAS|nr:unnamed protein product [Microthlaspi erraticum]